MRSRSIVGILRLSLSVVIGLSNILPTGKVLAQTEQVVQINVKVVDGKPTGKLRAPSSLNWRTPWLWDADFPDYSVVNPDLGITIIDTGSRYVCRSPFTVRTSVTPKAFRLEDTLVCVFTGVQISNNNVRLKIIDYDFLNDDLIGSGVCEVGQTCRIGQAEVTITKVPCGDTEIWVNYPTEPEYKQAYSNLFGLVTGYHRYPSEGENIESEVCSISVPGCTRKSVFETMLSQTRFIAPTKKTTPVQNCKISNLDIPNIPAGDDPILTTIDPEGFSIRNYTRFDHALHPGVVIRTVIEKNGSIFVTTYGEGYGPFPYLNSLFAPGLWKKDVDAGLVEVMKEKLGTK
jgi:hypothetical protein